MNEDLSDRIEVLVAAVEKCFAHGIEIHGTTLREIVLATLALAGVQARCQRGLQRPEPD